MAAQSSSNKGVIKRMGNFFKSTRAELKKVSWPNKKELTNYTIVVFSVCALISFVVWLLDTGFHDLLELIV